MSATAKPDVDGRGDEDTYRLKTGDRLKHLCFHYAGELGETYEATVWEHDAYGRVVTLECVSDRRYKSRTFEAGKIEANVNSCSETYGRGDTQRFEVVSEVWPDANAE